MTEDKARAVGTIIDSLDEFRHDSWSSHAFVEETFLDVLDAIAVLLGPPTERTFDVSGQGLHLVDPECGVGWCGSGYPKRCECGGLIHADFGEQESEDHFWLRTKCDKCGQAEP